MASLKTYILNTKKSLKFNLLTGWDNILASWEPIGCAEYFAHNSNYDNDKYNL